MRLSLTFLLLSFILTNCPTENDPNLVEMTASVNPEEVGVVNPPEGSYMIGREITIETEAIDDRYEFAGWSGDTTITEDSLSFVISRDMELIANYAIPSDSQLVLTTAADPIDAGIVVPDSGSFEVGSSVDVEAIANDGWAFTEWSGDTVSTANPLTITMDKDYHLTAHFAELAKAFSNTITISDGVNSMDLTFGMDASATHGYDRGIDRELPPPPPEGSFYGQLNIPDYFLAEDYRPVQDEFTNWVLEAAPDSGRTLSLNWDFSDTDHVGTLTLTDDFENPSFEIDMKSETSYEIQEDTVSVLYIIHSNEDIQR